ncbi:hypothetical protein R1flu_011833 [Riccia fluitans]|uniref:Uncharacterized protein n=1 Tax=Riccia fluitans TaxID=41844 RepID=A0ABD1Z8X2_9MARC
MLAARVIVVNYLELPAAVKSVLFLVCRLLWRKPQAINQDQAQEPVKADWLHSFQHKFFKLVLGRIPVSKGSV